MRFINPSGGVPVPSNRRIAEVSEALAQETTAVGIPYLDLMERLSGEESWYSAIRGTPAFTRRLAVTT